MSPSIFYGWCLSLSAAWLAAWLVLFGILTFVPIRYPAPFKARPLRHLTDPLCVVWVLSLVGLYLQLPTPSGWLVWVSLLYPAYYGAATHGVAEHLGVREDIEVRYVFGFARMGVAVAELLASALQ